MAALSDPPISFNVPSGSTGNLAVLQVGGVNKAVIDTSGNLTVAGKVVSGAGNHTVGGAAPATSSLDTHLTSATVQGNDEAGIITLVFDATGSSASIALCTVTFANASLYTNPPIVILTNQTQGAASTTLYAGSFGASAVTATTWVLRNGASASTASSTYVVGYQIIGRG